MTDRVFDFIIIGSGFGGSVSALRLAEKGYSVLVIERGKSYEPQDFPTTNWNIWKFLWWPSLRCFGIWEMTFLPKILVLHGSGLGGGSLVYAGVLMEPERDFFSADLWAHMGDWERLLAPHYQTALKMLGAERNPRLWIADQKLREIAEELGAEDSFHATEVGIYFSKNGQPNPDPFFNGEGPARTGCVHCGGCMVGCRYGAKNSLDFNYLYLARARGVEILTERTVSAIHPIDSSESEAGWRYMIEHRSTTNWIDRKTQRLYANNVIVSAGVLGTLKLLFRCRDELGSMPDISNQLGQNVRSNSEAFMGGMRYQSSEDLSEGLAITSVFSADSVTKIEPVRFPKRSSFIIFILGFPMFRAAGSFARRFAHMLRVIITRPKEFIYSKFVPGIPERSTILMVMQRQDNLMSLFPRKGVFKFISKGMSALHDEEKRIPVNTEIGYEVTDSFCRKMDAKPMYGINESLLDIPATAHLLGGCLFGQSADDGVISTRFEVHSYPGLYVIDGSVLPANPGINPSLTITALAEYAMSQIPNKVNR